jgi:hypothetical protein
MFSNQGGGEPKRWRRVGVGDSVAAAASILSLTSARARVSSPSPSHLILSRHLPSSSLPLLPPSPSYSSSNHPPPALPPLTRNPLGTTKRIYPSATSPADMGNCASSSQEAEGKARSDMIDRQIEEDSKKYKRECKILLLGACATPVLCHSEGNGEGKKNFV